MKFLLPHGFDPEPIVGPLKADLARWLVSTILHKLVAHDLDAQGYAVLSSTILERVMGHGYAKIVRALAEADVLERSRYREGKSHGYRLPEAYLAQRPRQVPVTNPVLIDRLRREYERMGAEQAARRLPIHDSLNDAQQGLTISPVAKAVVELLPRRSRLCQRVHVDRIERRDLRLTISTTGRIFNGLSGVKRELRGLVQLNGEPIASVDIRNAQPAILGNLLSPSTPTREVKGALTYNTTSESPSSLPVLPPAAVGAFSELASSGKLYDEIAEHCARDRNYVKKRFLADVLAKKGTYPSKVEQVFRQMFPAIWQAIQEINAKSHCELIRTLQRCESSLVIEQVSPRLVEQIPVITLHDAVFSRVRDLDAVEEAFHAVLEEIGWKLSLKREGASPKPIGKPLPKAIGH